MRFATQKGVFEKDEVIDKDLCKTKSRDAQARRGLRNGGGRNIMEEIAEEEECNLSDIMDEEVSGEAALSRARRRGGGA